jgi:hypothetical protein
VSAHTQPVPADRSRPTAVVSGDGDRLSIAGTLDISTLADARQALKKAKAGSLDIRRA